MANHHIAINGRGVACEQSLTIRHDIPLKRFTEPENREIAETGQLLKPEDVAKFLNVSKSTIKRWRYEGIGVPHIKLNNGAIRYSEHDVLKWLEEHKRT